MIFFAPGHRLVGRRKGDRQPSPAQIGPQGDSGWWGWWRVPHIPPGGGTPNGIRTRATALKGRRPWPLDDGSGLTRFRDSRFPCHLLIDQQSRYYFHSSACQD